LVIGKTFTATTLGFFYRAQSLNQMAIQYSFSSIQPVLFPAFCEIKDDRTKMRDSVISLLHIVGLLTFLLSGIMYVCAEDIIIILFTDKWLESAAIFKVLGLFTFAYTLPTILCAPLLSLGETGVLLKIEFIKKSLLTVAIVVGIQFGLYGYVLATQVACAVGVGINMYFLNKIDLALKTQLMIFFRYCIPFILLILVSNLLFHDLSANVFLQLILKALFFSTLYFLYCFLTKTVGLSILCNSILKPFLNKFRHG
jgi:O-antigen/teichoic acid export membrane protein